MQAALSAVDAARFLGISERSLHTLRKSPDFPAARIVGGRNRYLASELQAYLEAQPRATVGAEPPQLARSSKRRQIAPTPEVWPPPPVSARRMAKPAAGRKTVVADDTSRST